MTRKCSELQRIRYESAGVGSAESVGGAAGLGWGWAWRWALWRKSFAGLSILMSPLRLIDGLDFIQLSFRLGGWVEFRWGSVVTVGGVGGVANVNWSGPEGWSSGVLGRRRDWRLEAARLRGMASISKMVLRVIIEFTLKEKCF